jgi:uncharacterized protein
MKTSRLLVTILITLLVTLPTLVTDEANAGDKTIITCGTGTTGGSFYLLGSGMATILQRHIPNVIANAQATTGAWENVRLVNEGSATLGLAGGDHMYYGWEGKAKFEKPQDKIRLIAGTYIPTTNIVVHADSDIKSIADLKGKKITSTPGFGAGQLAPAILEAYGLTTDDVKIVPLGGSEAISTFADKNVDAFILAFGAPHPLITQVTKTRETRLLTMSDEKIAAVLTKKPFWVRCTIKAETYNGQKEDRFAVTSPVTWITSSDVSEELGYQITKTVMENSDEYAKIYRLGGQFNKENALKAADIIPLHPGAEKYYKEIGLIK